MGAAEGRGVLPAQLGAVDAPGGVLSVEQELGSGAVVTLCSASPALVLQPFADRLGIRLIGTELEVVDGVLTGKLTGNNCRCENKVLRLEAVYGDLGSTGSGPGAIRAGTGSCWRRRRTRIFGIFMRRRKSGLGCSANAVAGLAVASLGAVSLYIRSLQ